MTTEEALTAFATVILLVAIISVIAFVLSKLGQFRRSRQARAAFAPQADVQEDRTQWSDDAFGVPAPPPLTGEQPPAGANPDEAVVVQYSEPVPAVEPEPQPPPPLPPPPLPVPPPPPAPEPPEPAAADPVPPPLPPEPSEPTEQPTGDHWVLGSSPFLPTPRGGQPSAASIQRRYWQNLAAGDAADWLGHENLARLAEGKPPLRINRRSGRTEELQPPPLHEPGDEDTPPTWPSQAEDPFAGALR